MEKSSSRTEKEEFCLRESLSEPSFYAWQKRITKPDGVATVGRQPAKDTSSSTKLLPVALIEGVRSQVEPVGSDRLEIITPAGLTIRFGDSSSTERLLDLLASVLRIERQVGC